MNTRIKEVRKKLGLTQQKFAERIGMKQNSIALIESGKRNISSQAVLSICREFNVNPDWLKDGIGDMFIEPEIDTAYLVSELLENPDDEFYQAVLELVRTYKQLSPDAKKIICDFGKQYIDNVKSRKE